MSRAAAAFAAALVVAAPAGARPPEVVRWQDAAAHVGRVIAVEGTVVRARVAGGACTLEFADDPSALRVVLMLGLFSAPEAPERLYAGRRVRASGRVQSFQGRPEMIVRRADQIELLDDAATTTTLPPTHPPAAASPAPPAPSGGSAAPPDGGRARPPAAEACVRARARLDAATRELAARAEDAARCLRTGTSRCREERDAVALALEAVPPREAETDAACE